MKLELENGTILEGNDMVTVDIHDIADALLKCKSVEARNKELERENAVLIDAAESNSVLRKNVDKTKRVAKFQRTSSQLFRKASRSLWKYLDIRVGELREDGMRTLMIIPKGELSGGAISVFIPAEHAVPIEAVFKPDGTFANRADVFAILQAKEAEQKAQLDFDLDDKEE